MMWTETRILQVILMMLTPWFNLLSKENILKVFRTHLTNSISRPNSNKASRNSQVLSQQTNLRPRRCPNRLLLCNKVSLERIFKALNSSRYPAECNFYRTNRILNEALAGLRLKRQLQRLKMERLGIRWRIEIKIHMLIAQGLHVLGQLSKDLRWCQAQKVQRWSNLAQPKNK